MSGLVSEYSFLRRIEKTSNNTIILLLSIVFFVTRIFLINTLFFHIDDTCVAQSLETTYPLISTVFSKVVNFFYDHLGSYFIFKNPIFLWKVYTTRALSLMMSYIGFVLFLFLIKEIFKNKFFIIFSGILISFSQMHIVYSSHSSPYGYSMISSCVFLFIILYLKNQKLFSKKYFILLIALVLCPYIDNFSIVYLPALFLVLVASRLKHKIKISKPIKFTFVALSINTFLHLKYILLPILKSVGDGTNYNRGAFNEFILLKKNIFDIINHPFKTASFF